MIKCFWFIFLFSFVFSSKTLLSVGDSLFYVHDFYQQVPMSEWASFDSTKKERALKKLLTHLLIDSIINQEVTGKTYSIIYIGFPS